MSAWHLSGIQQVGIGNTSVEKTWAFYRKHFGFDVPVFQEEAVANLMLPYTGGEPRKRNATLALNMNGGGGLEIWQYTERTPQPPGFDILPGDLGIHTLKLKTVDVHKAFEYCKKQKLEIISEIEERGEAGRSFLLKDLWGNAVEITESDAWFQQKGLFGGVEGVAIGVSDMEQSIKFYGDLLGFDTKIWEEKDTFEAFESWSGKNHSYHRVILKRSEEYAGPFSPLLGAAHIELVQVENRTPNVIFKDRFWGDPGYIHLCFDIQGMEALKKRCEEFNHPFTVDSANSFDMGEAAGRFAYIEDPDGTLIEFVETHKVPILKKLNFYLNLRKRDPKKPLSNFMLKALGFNRVKD